MGCFVATASSLLIFFLAMPRRRPGRSRRCRSSPTPPFPEIKNWEVQCAHEAGAPGAAMDLARFTLLEVHGDGGVFYEGVSGILFITGHHRGPYFTHHAVAALGGAFPGSRLLFSQ